MPLLVNHKNNEMFRGFVMYCLCQVADLYTDKISKFNIDSFSTNNNQSDSP